MTTIPKPKGKGRGGKRPGSGRPKLGVGRAFRVTMSETEWAKIDAIIEAGHAASVADYFRQVHDIYQKTIGK